MNRHGTIFTYSIVHSGATAFQDKTPYLLALVEDGRELRMARVEGYTPGRRVLIGEPVEYLSDDSRGNPIYQLVRSACGIDQ